ncbi:MAG TPA: MlaD family protein [Candidatus Sulfotelmatobacter sp.]|nr:MlaD family protein [Candidatus Sulfotelmatobacter sp.]
MSANPNTFKIGLFTLIALGLLVAGVLAFGAKSYFVPKSRFETAVPGEVSGLSVGSSVELRGVPIGHVSRITFAWNVYPKSKSGLIVVEFNVEGNLLPLPPGTNLRAVLEQATAKGLRAVVKGQGITGTSILALETLDPNSNPAPAIDYTPRYYYVPSAPGQFTRMLESIEKSLDNLQHVDLAGIGSGVTNALDATTRLVNELNLVNLQIISTNANELLLETRALVTNLQENVQSMNLASIGRNADQLLAGLRDTNAKLQLVLNQIGTAPLQETVGDIRSAAQNLDDVLAQLKQYPSGFIFGEPPAPAQGVQTPSK